MSTEPESEAIQNLSREEFMSALFANMVFQNTNMALMLLGRVPHPESGERVQDFDAARMFIDQLEMLALKTQGNLSKDEQRLLQESLAHVRLAFAETVENTSAAAKPTSPAPSSEPAAPGPEPESRKRFSKKF